MSFIDFTQNWIKGELFEAKIVLLFGIITLISGVLFWKTGTTPNAKALLFPLLIVGMIYSSIGGGLLVSNQKRMVEMPEIYKKNSTEFIQLEKKRVEDFQYQYKISKIVATICFAVTLLLFWLTKNPTWQAIGIALTLFGLTGLVVDYFSEERAAIYYKYILDALN